MNSPPSTTNTYQAEPGGGPADPRVTRFVTLFIVGGILVTIAVFGRAEIARWYQAKAVNAFIDQEYNEAVTAANKALEWNPENRELIELRAKARLQAKDYDQCIADFDALLEQAASDGEKNERDIALLTSKAQALHQMKRFEQVLEIWDEIIEFRKQEFKMRDDHDSRYDYSMALNNRAYMLAQAYSVAEDKAAFDIEQALEQSRESIRIRQVSDDSMLLDTLGYLLLLNEQPAEALIELQKAVAQTKIENDARRKQLQEVMQSIDDQRPVQDAMKELDQHYSIILHHRGEAYEANGEKEKAEADIQEALRLGYNPEEGVW